MGKTAKLHKSETNKQSSPKLRWEAETRESPSHPSYQDKRFVAIGKKCCKDHTCNRPHARDLGMGWGGVCERLPLGRGETERGERECVCKL